MGKDKAGYIEKEVDDGETRETLWVCNKQLEIGIIFDVSVSISVADYEKVKKSLSAFLKRFNITDADMRVSLIPFENEIHTQHGFDLTGDKKSALTRVAALPHIGVQLSRRDACTCTYKALDHVRTKQLCFDASRSGIPRVCIVFTDGNSQEWHKTEASAKLCRSDGIKMYAVGFGSSIRMDELVRIAGDASRVCREADIDKLESIMVNLAEEVCDKTPQVKKQKKNIYFVFSKSELAFTQTELVINFIEQVVGRSNLEKTTYKWGIVSGVCPDDAGFNLVDDVQSRLTFYRQHHLTAIVNSMTKMNARSATLGEDGGVVDLVVLVVNKHSTVSLQRNVDNLKFAGADRVIIWNLSGSKLDNAFGCHVIDGQGLEQAVISTVKEIADWTVRPHPVTCIPLPLA